MITNQTMTKLKQVRLAQPFHMTQKELSIRSGIKLRTVQDYEQGHRKLSKAAFTTVRGLMSALNCEYSDIVDDVVDNPVD